MTIGERIKMVRKNAGLSQTAFAERLGATRGVITNLEGEKTELNEPFMRLICKEFNVSEEWLRTGEGEMMQKLTRNQEIAEFLGRIMKDPDDAPRKRFISIISKLDVEEWKLLDEIAKKMSRGE
jgi:transcriptional regulator with XRE-family HTH domain